MCLSLEPLPGGQAIGLEAGVEFDPHGIGDGVPLGLEEDDAHLVLFVTKRRGEFLRRDRIVPMQVFTDIDLVIAGLWHRHREVVFAKIWRESKPFRGWLRAFFEFVSSGCAFGAWASGFHDRPYPMVVVLIRPA